MRGDDPYLLALGWCLLHLKEDGSRLDLLADVEDLNLVYALSQLLINTIRNDLELDPRKVFEDLQRRQLGRLATPSEDRHHD